MPALLALLSSLAWGVADVAGGVATRRVGSPRTLALSYPAGALAITLFALTLVPGTIDSSVLWISIYTAIAGTGAMVLLYGALAIGPMGVVSPSPPSAAQPSPSSWGLRAGNRSPCSSSSAWCSPSSRSSSSAVSPVRMRA